MREGRRTGLFFYVRVFVLWTKASREKRDEKRGEVKMSRFSHDDVFGRCGVGFFGVGRRIMHDAPSENNRCCLREMGSRAVVR